MLVFFLLHILSDSIQELQCQFFNDLASSSSFNGSSSISNSTALTATAAVIEGTESRRLEREELSPYHNTLHVSAGNESSMRVDRIVSCVVLCPCIATTASPAGRSSVGDQVQTKRRSMSNPVILDLYKHLVEYLYEFNSDHTSYRILSTAPAYCNQDVCPVYDHTTTTTGSAVSRV